MKESYILPPLSLLEKGECIKNDQTESELKANAFRIQETLRTFGIQVTLVDICQGPVYTCYEFNPALGIRISSIAKRLDDIQLRLSAKDIMMEAPVPGKSVIGIVVRNSTDQIVPLRELLESREFRHSEGHLPFVVGKDIGGKTIVSDLVRMPHLLIAGTTGSGVSVFINTVILSLLYRKSPDEVKLVLIDPKVVELSVYREIPHLIGPIITDSRKASAALNWAVAEMEKRYKLFSAAGVRDLNGFNKLASSYRETDNELQMSTLPRIVIIIDELEDLMMDSGSEVEGVIVHLTQHGRAAGIHLIIATQRPTVDVISGLIKNNIPSRIAFHLTKQAHSRTILDVAGAEKLIGQGDMLFFPQSYQRPRRVQGAFVSDAEVTTVVNFVRAKTISDRSDLRIWQEIEKIAENGVEGNALEKNGSDPSRDDFFADAGRFIIEKNKASIGLLQRVFKIGFNRAARIMDQLAEAGVVTEESSTRARQVMMSLPEFENYLEEIGD